MSDLYTPNHEAHAYDFAAIQHLDEIIAELRDRGGTPRPFNILHYALELGLPEAVAINLSALAERRLKLEFQP
jgi:hypothetical protein